MLIDAEGITTAEAETRLRAMTLEIVIGPGAHNRAGHNAVLTAVAVGARTFIGGVSITLADDVELLSELPLGAKSLLEAVADLGASEARATPSVRIVIGELDGGTVAAVHAWWNGWTAGSSAEHRQCGIGDNPLAGIISGAASVAQAFAVLRGVDYPPVLAFDLWPGAAAQDVPSFGEVFFPGALWLLGLGNLGQAAMWSLAALPYPQPSDVNLVLQDRDKVSAENWGTSVLVRSGEYGSYKTAVAEEWARAKGFDVRRVDRWLDEQQHVQDGEPVLAVCGFDNIEARKKIDVCGFEAVIDAGLGRKHTDFDTYRVTIFDRDYTVARHFADTEARQVAAPQDYERLLGLDKCGAAVFEGIAVAVPFVSAIAGAIAVSRAIALCSGVGVPRNEVRRLSRDERRPAGSPITIDMPGLTRVSQNRLSV